MKSKCDLVYDFLQGRINVDLLRPVFGKDFADVKADVIPILEQSLASHEADEVELAVTLAHYFGLQREQTPILCKLLLEDWHTSHENIASSLQKLADPRSTDSLRQASQFRLAYLDYDENHGLARKCTWALAAIGTAEAIEALVWISENSDEMVAGYARKRLPQ